jgi:transposase
MTTKLDPRAEVLRLSLVEGKPVRAIARILKMSRKTIRRILTPTPAASRGSSPERRSRLTDAYDDTIRELVRDDERIPAPAVLERLRAVGFSGGITVVRDRLRELRPRVQREPFLTLEHPPGKQLQIDWFDLGFMIPGLPRRVSGFVAVLPYSRVLYLEFTVSQRFGAFIRCMERALAFFGGTAHADVFDNMKTVVLRRVRGVPQFHPRFVEYARIRDFAITACTPEKPNQKGNVERGIGFVRTRFVPGRRCVSLLDLNQQGMRWRDDFANGRVHETTGKVPLLVFNHHERRALKPITAASFDTDDIDTDTVTKSFRVRFDRNTYSVPPRLLSQQVLIRGNDNEVAVHLGDKEIARHLRSWSSGEDVEHPSHRNAAREIKQGEGRDAVPLGLEGLAVVGRDYLKILTAGSRSIRREVTRLVFLVEVFGAEQTRSAIDEVMRSGHVGAEYVEYVLRHRRQLAPMPPPLRLGRPELDGLALQEPDLSRYDEMFPTRNLKDP